MSEKWEDGNYVLYPAINHEQSLTDELLKSRQSPETLLARIAELSQAVGLITTLKPTMVMDVDHPLDMAKEVVEHVTARIAELEGKQRWIPVGERLPEIEEGDSKEYDVVITYPRERSVIVAWWTYNIFDKTHQRRIWTEDQGEFGHEDITKYVTHWRERPTPPEVK